MVDETITFEMIRKIQMEEQTSPKLARLPENFFEKVNSYINQKKKISSNKGDMKLTLELKNIERLVEDIYNRRERKILNQVIISARTDMSPENLIAEEKEYFERVLNEVKNRREDYIKKILGDKADQIDTVISFHEDTLEVVALDERLYCPHKKRDIATLPEEN